MKNAYIIIPVLLVIALLAAGCAQQQAQPSPQAAVQATAPVTVSSVSDTVMAVPGGTFGTILTDSQGRTLYYFAKDLPDYRNSACTGACAATWPAFAPSRVQVSSPLDPADFSSITRADGTRQLTYYGWPLYYYSGDTAPGDRNGDGILGLWFVFQPDETVLVRHTDSLGTFLTDTSGKTLYVFAKDTSGTSACTGTCLASWPAFGPGYPVTAPSIVDITDFAPVNRPDNMTQTAYRGMPLYYRSDDLLPGDTHGQAYNNLWFVANVSAPAAPAGSQTTAVPTAVPSEFHTLSPSSSGSGY